MATKLKSMISDGTVFTVAVADGQLTLSVPVETIAEYDPVSVSDWVKDNRNEIDEVCRAAISNEKITADEQAKAVKSVQK